MTMRSRRPSCCLRRRALARISARVMPGVSSTKSLDSMRRSRPALSLSLSSRPRKPVCSLRAPTEASPASMRRRRDSLDISSEKTATTLPSRTALFWAMLMAQAVLPMEGPGGDDDELGLLEAGGHLVELDEVGSEAGDLAALLVELVDGAEGVPDDVRDAGEAAGDGVLGDLHEAGFDLVEDVDGLEGLV